MLKTEAIGQRDTLPVIVFYERPHLQKAFSLGQLLLPGLGAGALRRGNAGFGRGPAMGIAIQSFCTHAFAWGHGPRLRGALALALQQVAKG